MTTLVCRLGTRHRVLIRTRTDIAPFPLYLGTVVENTGRPAHRRGSVVEAPLRMATMSAAGLCELLMCLDADAELYA